MKEIIIDNNVNKKYNLIRKANEEDVIFPKYLENLT